MGEASMRKWLRRARRSLPSGPNFQPKYDFLYWIALRERRKHRLERARRRLRRALAVVSEAVRIAHAPTLASLVNLNNALMRRLGLLVRGLVRHG